VDRFDDVEFRILEEPEPRRRPRSRTRLASLVTVTLAAGLFATSALATTDDPVAPQTPAKASKFEKRGHHGCKRGDRHRDRDSGESLGLRY
jgi:hypothetical protein